MRRSPRPMLLLAFALVAAVACGDSSGPAPAHVGTYTLRTVHGQPLPVILNGMQLQVFAGEIRLRENGTYTRSWSTEFYMGPAAPTQPNTKLECRGTYRMEGEYVTMTETSSTEGCGSTAAGFRPDTIMFVQDTLFTIYVK